MATNPFTGIITPALKTTFNNAIDAMLEATACTVPCQITYGDTKFTDCPNCIFSAHTGRSSNRYQSGGPQPFSFGNCPVCYGKGKIPDEQTESIDLIILWDYKDWIGFQGTEARTLAKDGFCQSMSNLVDTITAIKKAKYILLNTDLDLYIHHRFERYGEPNPIGFGSDRYLITTWKPIE